MLRISDIMNKAVVFWSLRSMQLHMLSPVKTWRQSHQVHQGGERLDFHDPQRRVIVYGV